MTAKRLYYLRTASVLELCIIRKLLTLHYKKAVYSDGPSYVRYALLQKNENDDSMLTFIIGKSIEFPGYFEKTSFKEYLALLRDFIDHSNDSSDPTEIKNDLISYTNNVQSDIKNDNNKMYDFLKTLEEPIAIDELKDIFPSTFRRLAKLMMSHSDDSAKLFLNNLDKFYAAGFGKEDTTVYSKLINAANKLKENPGGIREIRQEVDLRRE